MLRVKVDKEFEGPKGQSAVFNVLIEDKSGLTNVCSFGEDVVRLKALLENNMVCHK